MTIRARPLRHILAVAAGLAVTGLVFLYTGDADLFLAVGSGMGALCLVYVAAFLPRGRGWPKD